MKAFIVTAGSRGDVQPYLALARGLRAAGHQPLLCTSERFAGIIEAAGVPYAYMNDDILKLIDTDAGREAIDRSDSLLGWLRTSLALVKQVRPIQRRMLDEQWAAGQAFRPDIVLGHPKAIGGRHIAEKLGTPFVLTLALPVFTPTAEFPSVVFPTWPLGGRYNRLTYHLSVRLAWSQYGRVVNGWRREALDLPPIRSGSEELRFAGGPLPTICGISPHVLPAPADWPARTIVTGYWFLDRESNWEPPAELAAFLEAGSPPVYVGFGSMAGREPARITTIVLEALARSGRRGILATGWGGLDPAAVPEDVLVIREAPHDWLFPRVAAVVHHGGAGTTAAGLRAGRPTIICPFFGDQPFWGRRVAALGAGPAPIPQKKLTAGNLAGAISAATQNRDIQARAAEIGQAIRAEDGIGVAVRFLEECLA